jgi:hypothetical protein
MPPPTRSRLDATQGFEFMNEVMIAAWDLLADMMGEKEALALVSKEISMAARAGTANIIEWGVLKGKSPGDFASAFSYTGRMIGWGIDEILRSPEYSRIHNVDCQLAKGRHNLCDVHCVLVCNEMMHFVNLDCEHRIEKAIGRGDDECVLIITRPGIVLTKELQASMRSIEIVEIEEKMRLNVVPNYLHWYWTFMVNGLRMAIGETETGERLGPIMRQLGMRFGEEEGGKHADPVSLVCEPFMRLTALVEVPAESAEAKIVNCPFLGHDELVCRLMHNYVDGIAESSGRKVHWASPLSPECGPCILRLDSRQEGDDIRELKLLLKSRLVRGEITYEEYQRIRRELDE